MTATGPLNYADFVFSGALKQTVKNECAKQYFFGVKCVTVVLVQNENDEFILNIIIKNRKHG